MVRAHLTAAASAAAAAAVTVAEPVAGLDGTVTAVCVMGGDEMSLVGVMGGVSG